MSYSQKKKIIIRSKATLDTLTLKELKRLAKSRSLKGYSILTKSQLIKALKSHRVPKIGHRFHKKRIYGTLTRKRLGHNIMKNNNTVKIKQHMSNDVKQLIHKLEQKNTLSDKELNILKQAVLVKSKNSIKSNRYFNF